MIIATIVFFSVYLAFVGLIVLVGYVMHVSNRNSEKDSNIDKSEITVLVPFRNEEKRLKVLLESIQKLSSFPHEIIFINDHSNDGGVQLIKRLLVDLPYRIVHVPENLEGKKEALRYATEMSETKFILTWDADIYFKPDYFQKLAKLPEADMYLLPAVLKAESPVEYLYEIDVVLANAINVGLSGLSRPIMASGANLLYKRDVFNEVDDLDSHRYMASGDDTYLLRDFRRNEKDVRVISSLSCAVYTETPRSFREFIDQRLRWVGKTTDIKDGLGTFVALFQFVLAISFFVLIGVSLFQSDWNLLLIVFLGKIVADLVLFLPFFAKTKRLLTWALIPLYELLFPFYSLLLVVLMLTYKPRWKGRSIT